MISQVRLFYFFENLLASLHEQTHLPLVFSTDIGAVGKDIKALIVLSGLYGDQTLIFTGDRPGISWRW